MISRSLGVWLLLMATTVAAEAPAGLAETKAAFAKADRNLNDAWTMVRKKFPEKVFTELKTKQREWIEGRDRLAAAEDPARAAVYWDREAKLAEERALWLRGLIGLEVQPLTGLWIDGAGAELEIVEQEKRLLFVLHVVRRTNVGVLAGMAAWNQTIGWFSDKGREQDKPDETNLSFTERDGHLEVIAANAEYYHGHHAYFDGTYYKIAPLDEKQQQAVVKAGESGQVPDE